LTVNPSFFSTYFVTLFITLSAAFALFTRIRKSSA